MKRVYGSHPVSYTHLDVYKRQLDFFEDIMGKENRKYIPYLITVLIYIGIANIIGLFGFKSPTKDLNVTAVSYTHLI